MVKRVALVTGASSGIGADAARMLAAEGYFVYAAGRNMEKLEAIRTETIEPLLLDVNESDSIHAAIEQIKSDKGRIDLLVNNAGYGGYGMIEGMPIDEARRQFDVNVFGAMEVTQAILPMMREARSGRIIQLGSIVSHVSLPALGWYAASKHAIKALMDALRLEVKQFGIDVVMIEPGAIATGFEEIAIASLEKNQAPKEYQPMVDKFTRMVRGEYSHCPGPEVVTAVIREAVTAANPKSAYTDRLQTRLGKIAKHVLPDSIFDWIIAKQLK